MNAFTSSERELVSLFEQRTGQRTARSHSWRIENALAGLYRENNIHSMDELAAMLRKWPESALSQQVVEALLNNETYFFRDRGMFDTLINKVLPEVARSREAQRRLSVWSAGCSTGQEAYSLAMAVAEQGARWDGWTIDIMGTDVSAAVVETAREAVYSSFQVQRGLSVMQMLNWFDESPDGWRLREPLRSSVRFRVHNLLDPMPSFQKFDIILCRNVLLYFDGAGRKRIFENLARATHPNGWLMLGAGEATIGQTSLFANDRNITSFFRPA